MAKHDEQVKLLMGQVEEKKKALGPRPKAVLATNGVLKISQSEHVNLNTLSDMEALVKAYVYPFHQHHLAVTAAADLGILDHKPMISGYPLEDWKTDFTFRMQLIAWNKKEADLNAMSRKLDSLVSEDLKTETELAALADLLK